MGKIFPFSIASVRPLGQFVFSSILIWPILVWTTTTVFYLLLSSPGICLLMWLTWFRVTLWMTFDLRLTHFWFTNEWFLSWTAACIVSRILGECLLLVRIHGNVCWIFVYTETCFIPSRFLETGLHATIILILNTHTVILFIPVVNLTTQNFTETGELKTSRHLGIRITWRWRANFAVWGLSHPRKYLPVLCVGD
jgi:hypothetical protein